MIRIKTSIEGDGVTSWVARQRRQLALAVTAGVTAATEGLKTELRAEVERAGLGDRLPRAVRSQIYPSGRASLQAAGLVHPNGKGAAKLFDLFTEGAVIRGKQGFYLAIPTEAAGKFRGQKMSPALWEQRHGMRLRFVYRRGQPSLLVAGPKGRAGSSPRRRQRGVGKQTTLVIFLLVPQVTIRPRLRPEPLALRWADRIPSLIARALPTTL
jgi:hypothetical protein